MHALPLFADAEPGPPSGAAFGRAAEPNPGRGVLGVDPGLSGALVLLIQGALEVRDMPIRPAKGKGNDVDWHAVGDILREWQPGHAYLEKVQAGGGQQGERRQGVSSMFKFGGAFHGMQAALSVLQIPYTLIAPQSWKRAAGLVGTEKDYARTRAMQAFPGQAGLFKRKKDVGRADAALIALAGEQKAGRV